MTNRDAISPIRSVEFADSHYADGLCACSRGFRYQDSTDKKYRLQHLGQEGAGALVLRVDDDLSGGT